MSDDVWIHLARRLSWWVPLIAFFVVAGWETIRPRMMLLMPATRRWAGNFGLYAIFLGLSMLALGAGYGGLAAWSSTTSFGLWQSAHVSPILRFILGIVVMDLSGYGFHWLSHNNEFLWRLHETHHSDSDYDLSTGIRFHPIEACLDTACTCAVIALCAVPVSAAVVYSILVQVATFFEHANAIVLEKLDRAIRSVFISTNAHRNHHSVELRLQQSNYGILLSGWDRLFGTWTEPAEVDQYGVQEVSPEEGANFWYLLLSPFRRAQRREAPNASSQPVSY